MTEVTPLSLRRRARRRAAGAWPAVGARAGRRRRAGSSARRWSVLQLIAIVAVGAVVRLLQLQRGRLQQRRGRVRGPGRVDRARPDAGAVLPGLPRAPAALPVDRLDRLPARAGATGGAGSRACCSGWPRSSLDLRARPAALRRPGGADRAQHPGADAVPRGGHAGRCCWTGRRRSSSRSPCTCSRGTRTRGGVYWLYAAGVGDGPRRPREGDRRSSSAAAIYAFFALAPDVPMKIRHLLGAAVVMAITIIPFPLAIALQRQAEDGRQLPGLAALPPAEPLVRSSTRRWCRSRSASASCSLRSSASWSCAAGACGPGARRCSLCWIIVPAAFFELWPVKGFQYLLPVAPAVALLAARLFTLELRPPRRLAASPRASASCRRVALGVLLSSLAVPAYQITRPSTSRTFLAGSGGVPGGREMGAWIRANVPEGARCSPIGPSMANIVSFYGHRKAYGLSVSRTRCAGTRRTSRPATRTAGSSRATCSTSCGTPTRLPARSSSRGSSPTTRARSTAGSSTRTRSRCSAAAGPWHVPVIRIYEVRPK